MSVKCSILLQQMNLWTDSEWKCAPEPESKSEIERKYLHHRDMTN